MHRGARDGWTVVGWVRGFLVKRRTGTDEGELLILNCRPGAEGAADLHEHSRLRSASFPVCIVERAAVCPLPLVNVRAEFATNPKVIQPEQHILDELVLHVAVDAD